MNYQPTYLGEIELSEDTLAHFGVKGMKWGKRIRSAIKNNPISKRRRKNRYIASKMADDIASGRRKLDTSNRKRPKGGYIDTPESGNARNVRIYKNGVVAALSKYGRKDPTHPAVGAEHMSRVETTTLRDLQKAQESLRWRKKK